MVCRAIEKEEKRELPRERDKNEETRPKKVRETKKHMKSFSTNKLKKMRQIT